jgi:hypothetical protein
MRVCGLPTGRLSREQMAVGVANGELVIRRSRHSVGPCRGREGMGRVRALSSGGGYA